MSALLNIIDKNQELSEDAMAPAIREMVAQAADVVAPVWPIKNFIACNPLQGLEDLPFEQAVSRSAAYAGASDAASNRVNRELIKWCSAFLDEGQATIAMPNRYLGFYRVFSDLARFDRNLRANADAQKWLTALPKAPEDAIADSFKRLNIAVSDQEDFVRLGLATLPGWSGYVKWRTHWQDATEGGANPITLVDYVAVRLVLTCMLMPGAKMPRLTSTTLPDDITKIEAAETTYRAALLSDLMAEVGNLGQPAPRPDAQLVFCIDVRSEPFRRSLEAQGPYQTFGFAGFFGLPVRVKGYDDDPHDSCPVLLKPCHEVCERPTELDPASVRRHDDGRALLKLPKSFYQALKYNFATPFALVEMLGPWCGLRMLARTYAPLLLTRLNQAMRDKIMPTIATELDLSDISLVSQVGYGEGALRMIGLNDNFAPVVVFCGHGSSTSNNAYAAALDCGACGGNHGGINARILAAILNKAEVRASLTERGLHIPEDTVFAAAEHDTTTDHVTMLGEDADNVHPDILAELKKDLGKAADCNRLARCATFGLSPQNCEQACEATQTRSCDWSEVRPEWGLARNAAFIVGPRELTRNINLGGRSFLHSYDWKGDEEESFLQTILTAPMVVAQWINSQYLFSTLDNVVWGGGSKVTQNVTGKLGVMQGNASDLMHGLPLQSVYAADNAPYHEPLRLLTVVYAPRQRVQALIERNQVLQKLFFNGWVNLAVIDPNENRAYHLQRDSTWKKIS